MFTPSLISQHGAKEIFNGFCEIIRFYQVKTAYLAFTITAYERELVACLNARLIT